MTVTGPVPPSWTSPENASARARPLAATPLWAWCAPGALLLLAAFLDLFQLTRNGYGNLYYAAAVRSMLSSWHGFFFVSVAYPPLGLWMQAASAKLFGFQGWSLLLPQALAGIGSVLLLYHLVRRVFGIPAGLIAGLALALTPISVATNRDNTVDSLLVLTVLLAAWAASLAAETGHLRWLLLCAALVGLGFNIKMLQAYLVVPAFALVYLCAAPHRWHTRIAHLALAGGVLVALSLSWALVVDLTPASQRPYVGSSTANSEIQLALGYNGLDRLTGFLRIGTRSPAAAHALSSFADRFSMIDAGAPGPLRLLSQRLGGQISWLLPLAGIGLLALCLRFRPRAPAGWRAWRPARPGREQQAVILWGCWLLTQAIFFSIAGFIHAYYLVMLAPAISALVGIGLVQLWADFRRPGWRGWLLPAALLITALVQVHLLASAPTWVPWLAPLLIVLCLACAGVLAISRAAQSTRNGPISALRQRRLAPAVVALALGLCMLALAPTIWSVAAIEQGSGLLPQAGPAGQNGLFAAATRSLAGVDPKLLHYLKSHQEHTTFLVATLNAIQAAPIILKTDQPVMALGGFMGGDPILTPEALAQKVKEGKVRFFLLPTNLLPGLTPAQIEQLPPQQREIIQTLWQFAPGFGGRVLNTSLTRWVKTQCAPVPRQQWSSSGTAGQLFDCTHARS